MKPADIATVKVPGATLYYEVRGSGPILLLICGGIYDAATYAGLAQQLADRYTVVTYDRRGNSRSLLDGPPKRQSIEVHADDAYRVLTAVGCQAAAAYVFGNSSGGQIGLELAARHPELVRTLVVHEPPIFELLSNPDRDYWRTVIQGVEDTFLAQGAGAAMQALGAGFAGAPQADVGAKAQADGRTAAQVSPPDPDPEMAAAMDAHLEGINKAMEKNMEIFIGYEVPPFAECVPNIAALKQSSTRIVAAVGVESSEREPMLRATFALAEQLGTQPVVFPGDHGGFDVDHEAFAAKLHEVLSSS